MTVSTQNNPATVPVICLVIFDLMVAYFGAAIAEYIRFKGLLYTLSSIVLIQALLMVLFSVFTGVYLPWRGRPLAERLGKVILAWTLAFVTLSIFMVFTKTAEAYSRVWMGVWGITAISLAVVLRLVLYFFLMQLRSKGRNSKKILIVGKDDNFIRQLKHQFGAGNPFGYRLTTVIRHNNSPEETLKQVQALLDQGELFDECWICLPITDTTLVEPIMLCLRHSTMDIRYMPDMQGIPLLNHKVTTIGGFYSIDISCSPMDSGNHILKRLEDLVLGSIILVLILPVFLVVALAVKLSSPGPVFFRQQRHGANGQPIEIYKFRSMKVHDEKRGKVTQATKGDSRITPVGAFIRKTSLDELPQFINVIQGRMSIVGPRPHALAHNEYYKDLVQSYMKRHKVKPGITGLAQIRGFRGETDTLDKMQRRVECDLEYLNNWSLWMDIRIIVATVFKGFVNPNAY